ncbi:MAG: OB-fold domain-containing protein [Microbacteriaceae bacterium]|nr:OB-fold domain-containing protein [Microbacteriaceae bacterium]MCL2794320.1 OB-fold domain-containing protein [Microbacteriaceae bacterium]
MTDGPVPRPTPETLPFWEGTAAGELRIQRCTPCDEFYFYPRPFCPKCLSSDVAWEKVSGNATLASYNINYRPGPAFSSQDPLVIALVELDEGPRMMTNIVGVPAEPEALPLGMRLTVGFQPRGDQFLPVFSPAEGA